MNASFIICAVDGEPGSKLNGLSPYDSCRHIIGPGQYHKSYEKFMLVFWFCYLLYVLVPSAGLGVIVSFQAWSQVSVKTPNTLKFRPFSMKALSWTKRESDNFQTFFVFYIFSEIRYKSECIWFETALFRCLLARRHCDIFIEENHLQVKSNQICK
jgi:hypothetical protein